MKNLIKFHIVVLALLCHASYNRYILEATTKGMDV